MAILEDIDKYLEKNLNRPAERILVMGLIKKLLKENVVTKPIFSSIEYYYCDGCNTWMDYSDLEEKKTPVSYGQIDPPDEYCECSCGHQIAADDIEVYDSSEIIELLNKKEIKG